jgi:hypothetical protein
MDASGRKLNEPYHYTPIISKQNSTVNKNMLQGTGDKVGLKMKQNNDRSVSYYI